MPFAFHATTLRRAVVAVALTTLVGAGAYAAAADPKATIPVRQARFKQMGGAFKVINDQLKTDAPARDQLVAAARVIAASARVQATMFPAGSGPAAGVKTDALPAIWTDRATFDAQMAKLVGESTKLAAIAGTGDLAAVRAQAKATGATCGACHRQFRADD